MNDHRFEQLLELGRRNQDIIELARHHCSKLQFRASGGHGMAEAASGLPTDMREIYCDVGGLGPAAHNLQLIAGDYVREHCRECPSRAASGRMPNLLTVVESEDAAAERRRQESEAAEAEAVRRARWRRDTRTALLAASGAGTHQLREDLNLIDAPCTADRAPAVAAAHTRLTAVARRAPELFSGELIGQFFTLVREQHEDRLLVPLRYLARAGVTPADRVAALACEVLALRPSSEAAACLVDFPRSYRSEDMTREVILSCVRLVAGPVFTRTGRRESPESGDPAGLVAATDANLPAVLNVVVDLLTTSPPDRPSVLVIPPGSAVRTTGDVARAIRDAEARRHQGGVAARVLLAGSRCMWKDVAGPLLQALAVPDADHFDLLPSHEVAAAVAEAMLSEFDAVIADLGRVVPASSDHAERLVGCLEHCRRLLSRDDPFLHREIPETVCESLAPRLCQAAVGLLDDRWGFEARFQVATLVDDLAKQFPAAMAVHADALLGHMLLMHAPSQDSSVFVHPSPMGVPPALERLSRKQTVQSSVREVRSALARCASQDPLGVVEAVLEADFAAGRSAHAGKQDPRVLWVQRDCLELVCRIAAEYGQQPGVVARVLPLLYRRLLGEDALLRAAAVRAWALLAARHSLPGSLADCGPALLQDPYLAVLRALLIHGRSLLHERDMWSLIVLAARIVDAYRNDENEHDLVALALDVLYSERTRWDADQVPQVELWILDHAAALPAREAERMADRLGWSSSAAHSKQMAAVRMAVLHDPSLNSPFTDHDDLRFVHLMETAGGGVDLPYERFEKLVRPDWTGGALLLVECLQRFGRWGDARALARHIYEHLPPVPAYDGHRDRLEPVLEHTALQADPSLQSGRTPVWPVPAPEPGERFGFTAQSDLMVHARLALRGELLHEAAGSGVTDPSTRHLLPASERLDEIAARVEQLHQQATPTAAFLRAWAESLRVASHLMQAHGALRQADLDRERAHRQAAFLRAEDLQERLDGDDPLHMPLLGWLEQVHAAAMRGDRLAAALADVPVPLQAARGCSRISGYGPAEPVLAREEDPVVVCLLWLDDRRVTHGQVVHRSRAYTLRVEFRMDVWPSWADRLDVELLSVLRPDELVVPSFRLARSMATGGTGREDEGVSVRGEGTLVVRFALGAGQPAQTVRVVARFRSADGSRLCTADLAGYPELRLRPFDSTRDALTALPQVDARLLALHERVREFTDDEETLQAFGRLLAAVTAVAAELTYDQLFRRGRNVSEARFHDEVDRRLKQDPLLGGRVSRATRQGLGITDVVHDNVTCELKVERHKAFDVDRSRRYLGQPTQYAAAVQRQLSILLVLDVTKKQQPVGVQENYLWLMRPDLHATEDAPAPALVAVVMVNAGLIVPSSWSRRTITAEEIDLDAPRVPPVADLQPGEPS
ncbi:hypothetical protein ACIQVT_00415 [Streptomyces sp. NPDC100445]|uniref:hypothetical protein n=1 Tax=Streptomyces sp. NPDC100445 TaxID=3366102 RepID=UPI00380D7B6F